MEDPITKVKAVQLLTAGKNKDVERAFLVELNAFLENFKEVYSLN